MDIFLDPRMLPCAHTLCKGCMESLMRDSSIACPVCRAKHAIPPNKSDGFPRNFVVAGMIDSWCGECRSKESEVECSHCNKRLCVGCQTNHLNFEGGIHSLKEVGLTLLKGEVALNDTVGYGHLSLVVEKEIKKVEELIVQKVRERAEKLTVKIKTVIKSNIDSRKPWKDNVNKYMEETQSYLDTMTSAIGEVFGDHVTEKLISDIKTQSRDKIRNLELAISKAPLLSRPFINYDSAEVISAIMSFWSIDLHPPGTEDCHVAVDTCTIQPDKPKVVGKEGSGPGEYTHVWRSREYMYLWVTLDIVGLFYFSHSVWPVRLLG